MKSQAVVKGTLDVVLMAGLALGLAALAGCGSSGSGGGGGGGTQPTGALAPGGASNIYAIENSVSGQGDSVLTFSADTSGEVSPTGTLALPSTISAFAVATDGSGQIYVGGYSTSTGVAEILVYAAGATGTAMPARTILPGPNDELAVNSMAVDGSGQIYICSYNEVGEVAVFAAGANGSVEPSSILTSPALTAPIGIAVDSTGKIYVSNIGASGDESTGGQILVFAAGANGSDAPVETISTEADTATSATVFYGVAVDASGNIFAVKDSGTFDSSGNETSASGAIEEFAPGATGAATPIKTITGTSVGFTYGGALRLDSVGNAYLIGVTEKDDLATFSLLGFGPNASGNVAPGLTITSTALSNPSTQMAVH